MSFFVIEKTLKDYTIFYIKSMYKIVYKYFVSNPKIKPKKSATITDVACTLNYVWQYFLPINPTRKPTIMESLLFQPGRITNRYHYFLARDTYKISAVRPFYSDIV